MSNKRVIPFKNLANNILSSTYTLKCKRDTILKYNTEIIFDINCLYKNEKLQIVNRNNSIDFVFHLSY